MSLQEKLTALAAGWKAPAVNGDIPHGDMPGDKVEINDGHIAKAGVIFPLLIEEMQKTLAANGGNEKIVVTVCGGSGVGKSEIASLLSYYLNAAGIGAYTLSGDNYPRRIPRYNDAERLQVFRHGGVRALAAADLLTAGVWENLEKLQEAGDDARPSHADQYDWFATYLAGGRKALAGYLGSAHEIAFDELTDIVAQFKAGTPAVYLKRMGRTENSTRYEKVDLSATNVLIIEWTHGNSDNYTGVDIPVLLNSTPAETLAHRASRARDGAVDSPFTTMALELEQAMLVQQSPKAKIIVSKAGKIITAEEVAQ